MVGVHGGGGELLVDGASAPCATNCCAVLMMASFLVVGSAVGAMAAGPGERLRLDLDGTWQFRMDPEDQGLAQKWFDQEVDYPDKIVVPGNWQAQGFGPARGHLRHDYQGKAWHRRTANVPGDWAGRRIWLHLGGVTNTADVFVSGRKVGFVEGFITPYEFDVTEAVTPGGVNVIACRVDSTGPAPVGMFNFIGRWGGLFRSVYLEARSDPAIDDVFVMPDVRRKTARTQVVLKRSKPGGVWEGELTVRIRPAVGGASCEGQSVVRFADGKHESDAVGVDAVIKDMRPWSPEDPFLYSVEVALSADGRVIDVFRDRFGMRQFEVGEGGVLLLNGRPYFVRGLGDDSVEVLTGTPPPDKQAYIDRLRQAKRYGFNGTRLLSHTPIKEYFEAADEVGFLIMCDGEVYNRDRSKEVIPLLKKQVTRIAKAYRNHPSWYIWSSANEIFACEGPVPDPVWMDYVQTAHDTFKRLDPTRFFVATDGADVFPTDIITKVSKFGSGAANEQPFHGLIDEVAYFKKALPDRDVAALAERDAGSGGSTYAERVRSLGPSGYWRLDETAPGKAVDASGHGNDGVYDETMTARHLNQPGALAPAKGGGAIRVDGERRGVCLSGVAASTLAAGDAPFSVSLWIKPDGFAKRDYGTPFSYGATATSSGFIIAEDGHAGTGKVRLGRFMQDFLVSKGRLRAGEWNHVGVTYDGAVVKLFLNGSFDASVKVTLSTVVTKGRIGGLISQGPDPSEYRKRPHIWHEFPNTYVGTLPDLSIMDKWTGVFRDDHCIAHHRKQVAGLGLSERYAVVRQRSIDLFYLYLKQAYEGARRSKTMDGYAYWCHTDFPGGPEGDMPFYGMFSTVYEPEKFPDPAPILRFNRETVLLIDAGPSERVLGAGEIRNVVLTVSHYDAESIRGGRLVWEVRSSGEISQRGIIDVVNADVGEVKPVGTIGVGPCSPAQGQRLRLHVRLESQACRQENQWDFWVFPDRTRDLRGQQIANLTGVDLAGVGGGAAPSASLKSARLVLANGLTDELMAYLARGGTVVLLSEKGALARPRGFTFWSQWIRSTGTFIERHPALNGFPHDGFCAYQFYRLFGAGLEAVNMTDPGAVEREKLTPILWGLNQDRDTSKTSAWHHLQNRWRMFRYGIVCEGRVGKGRILVCSLRVLAGIRSKQPEAGYLLHCLIEYALSPRFAPTSPPMTIEEAGQVFTVRGLRSRRGKT